MHTSIYHTTLPFVAMSSVKKKPNKNKNKIATDVKPAAPTPAAAAAPPANKNATNKTSQTGQSN